MLAEDFCLYTRSMCCIFKDYRRVGFEPKNVNDVVHFLRNENLCNIIPEFFRLIRIILTVPVANATCERSYSALRRLKTFVRNSMCAERLNYAAVMHIHSSIDIDLESLIDEFISRSAARVNTFAKFK